MLVVHKIMMDLTNPRQMQEIEAVQGDSATRVVEMVLLSGPQEQWLVPEDAAVMVRYGKSDGTGGVYDTLPDGTQAWSAEENILRVTLAPQMLSVPGAVQMQAQLLRGEKSLATFSVLIHVKPDPSQGVCTSERYENWQRWAQIALDERLRQAQEAGAFTGATPQLSIGNVVTVASNVEADALLRGTAEEPVLDLWIPKGNDAAVDTTLTQSGQGADAAAVGTALGKKLDTAGGSVTGWLDFAESSKGLRWTTADGTLIQLRPYSPSNIFQLTMQNSTTGVAEFGAFGFKTDGTPSTAKPFPLKSMYVPEMTAGTEYSLPEKYNGKQVYGKLLSCGTAADGKTVSHGISSSYAVISCTAAAQGITAPYSSQGGEWYFAVGADTDKVVINCGSSIAGKNVYALLKYTK